jgi:hypothetical protein
MNPRDRDGVGQPDTSPMHEAAEQARTLDGGACLTPPLRLDASYDCESSSSRSPVESPAGGGAGVGPDSSHADANGPDADPSALASFAACASVHAVACEVLADPKRFGRCLSHDAISKLCYYAWRICDRLEREIGLCRCRRRNPRVPGSRCVVCGWTAPRPTDGRPRAERKPAPGGTGEVPP